MIFGDIFESSKTKAVKEQTAAIKENTKALLKNDVANNKVSKSSSLMQKALTGIKKIGITAVIAGITYAIYQLATAEEKLRDKAQGLGSELEQEKSDIDNYKQKINELQQVIQSDQSSFEEVAQARIGLMSVQDELIDKFGTEKGVIADVTNAINGQADALDNLAKKSYYKKKAEINDKSIGDKIGDFITYGADSAGRAQTNMDKIISTMESATKQLTTSGNNALDELISKTYDLNIYSNMYDKGKHFQISGSLQEVYDTLLEIQELSAKFDVSSNFETRLADTITAANNYLESYQEIYNNYILYEKILDNSINNSYDEKFNAINKAKQDYDKAVKNGNEQQIETTSQEFQKTVVDSINVALKNGDADVAEYFRNMYPELQQVISEWEFSVNFKPNTDGLKDKITDALSDLDGMSTEDILNFNTNVATQEQIDAYGVLNNVAQEYGMTLEQLVALLEREKLILSEHDQDLVNVFGQDNINSLDKKELNVLRSISKSASQQYIEEAKNQVNQVKDELQTLSEEGNVDLTIRPQIDSSLMQAAGYDVEDGAIATTYTSGEFIWQGSEQDGEYVYVHYTPILPNGNVLNTDSLNDYLHSVLEGSENILDADTKGIVMKVESVPATISETDIQNLQNGQGSTSAIDMFLGETGEWDEHVHLVQEDFYGLGETIDYVALGMQNAIKDAMKTAAVEASNTTATITDSVKQIATQLKPQMDALGEVYTSIFADNGKKFNLEVVDTEMQENIRKTFLELGEDIGMSFEDGEEAVNEFLNELTRAGATAESVQNAFNKLATKYFYCTDTLENLNEATAANIIQGLEQMGITNAQEVVMEALRIKNEEVALSKALLAEETEKCEKLTISETIAFLAEAVAAEECGAEIALLQLKKILVNGVTLNTKADIENVLSLAKAAGFTSDALIKLQEAKSNFDAALKGGDPKQIAAAREEVEMENARLRHELTNYKPVKLEVDYDYNKIEKNSKKAGKEAKDAYLEEFQKLYDKLKDLRDRGKITEKEYLDALQAMNRKYFADKKKYAEEYAKYEREYLEGYKKLYQDAMSYAASLIDKQIDAHNKNKDAAVDALEKERDARLDAIEAQKEQLELQIDAIDDQIKYKEKIIDGIQDEIDAIRDANDEKERQNALTKAQYELERSMHQRNKLVYKDGQMVWENDPQAIRDNQQAVDDAKTEIEIAEKEKQISAIEKEIDILNDRKDAINDQIDLLDKQSDAINDFYDKQIKATEEYWDSIIKGLESTKSRWEELAELEEQAKMQAALSDLGLSIEDILSGDEATFNAFKETYLKILNEMYSGNNQMIDSLNNLTHIDVGNLPSFLEETQGYIDTLRKSLDFTDMNDSWGTLISGFENAALAAGQLTGAITGGSIVAAAGKQGQASGDKASSGGGSSSALGSIETLSTEGVPKIEEVGNAFAGGEGDDSGESMKSKVESAAKAIGTGEATDPDGGGDTKDLQSTLALQTQEAINEESGVPAQILKWAELNEELAKVLQNLKDIQQIMQEMGTGGINFGGLLEGFSFGGNTKATGGKSTRKETAMTSEYNQPEAIVRKNGTYEITTQPTLVDLNPGDEVLNGTETKKLLKSKPEKLGNAYANGTGSKFVPLKRGDNEISDKLADNIYKLMESNLDTFNNAKLKNNYNPDIKNISATIHNEAPNIDISNVSFTCSGVTGEQVLRQIEGEFEGLVLKAYQKAMTKK